MFDKNLQTPEYEHGLNLFVIFTVIMAAIAGLLFGFDTGNISGALIFIQHELKTTVFQDEIIVSITVLGAFFGAIFSGKLVSLFGRRRMLLIASFIFALGAWVGAASYSVTQLIFARLILGLAIGVTSYAAPLYISEIAPAKYRGGLVLLNGVAITGGQAVAFLVDYAFAGSGNWRMMIFTGCVPAIVLFIGMLFMPYSPRWLLSKTQNRKAIRILKKIRGAKHIGRELLEIRNILRAPHIKLTSLFTYKRLRMPLIIGLGLGILQQLCGINTIMYYGPFIFKHAGFRAADMQIFATLLMGLMNTLITLIMVFVVDKFGRRKFLIGGTFLASISLLVMSYIFHHGIQSIWTSYLMVVLMLCYIIGYSASLGSLFWLIIAEIFPLRVRGVAMGFVTAIQWLANFAVSLTFLTMLDSLGDTFTFAWYGLICLASMLFAYFLVPETKGKSLEEIEMQWLKKESSR